MAWQPTAAEKAAYAHMQARLITLLLRHDEAHFRRHIGPQIPNQAEEAVTLQRYRDLGVFFHLADELFEHIVPRIVRRLSFEAPRSVMIEEPPARGRVDWERTLDATWAERPGEPPLRLHTRQRRRHFATPENLLTVATLLEYREDVLRLLWGEKEAIGAEPLRHPLNAIVENCERELLFPQFAGLKSAAQEILDGAEGGLESLEAQVQERLMPGGNNAYEELLMWRARRRGLQLLQRDGSQADDVLGADPKRDNFLYQLWIFLELADLLKDRGQLLHLQMEDGRQELRYRWGDGAGACVYELRHNQAVPRPVVEWETDKKLPAPGVRPDFYLYRVDPPGEEVKRVTNGREELYWREPGLVWDAKYYRERDSNAAPSEPIKRLIGDLTLLGETSGTLLFAFLQNVGEQTTSHNDEHRNVPDPPAVSGYRLLPQSGRGRDQSIVPRQEVVIRQLQPTGEIKGQVHQTLEVLLNAAHRQLRTPRTPQCYGMFLDTLGTMDTQALKDRYGKPLGGDLSDVLVCPKPHIGAWRVDLVSRTSHCCKNPAFCHVFGRVGSRPPIRPARDARELLQELKHLALDPSQLDEEAISAFEKQVKEVSRRYAELAGFKDQLMRYRQRVRSMGLRDAYDRLGRDQQESLALAVFLAERLGEIEAQDYSAPAIHLSGVLEHEVRERVFRCPDLVSEVALPHKQTLGQLPYMRYRPEKTFGDWARLVAYAAQHWQEQFDPDIPHLKASFHDFVTLVDQIKEYRNKAAHTHPLTPRDYERLEELMFQPSRHLNCGALKAILLAWRF